MRSDKKIKIKIIVITVRHALPLAPTNNFTIFVYKFCNCNKHEEKMIKCNLAALCLSQECKVSYKTCKQNL